MIMDKKNKKSLERAALTGNKDFTVRKIVHGGTADKASTQRMRKTVLAAIDKESYGILFRLP
jgi:hypothetical protein